MLISFVLSLQQQAHSTVLPFATSAFQKHALTALTGIVANVVGGVSKLPLAKFIDVVGRPQGFLICLVFVVGCEYSCFCSLPSRTVSIVKALTDMTVSTGVDGCLPDRGNLLCRSSPILVGHERHRLRFQRLHRRHLTLAESSALDCLDRSSLHLQCLCMYQASSWYKSLVNTTFSCIGGSQTRPSLPRPQHLALELWVLRHHHAVCVNIFLAGVPAHGQESETNWHHGSERKKRQNTSAEHSVLVCRVRLYCHSLPTFGLGANTP
jgi:hypothetical protein